MVKMIVTDVDGTIVGKDEILHDAMTSYVKQLKEKQIDYTIATGRCAGLVKDYVEQLGIEVPYIACNGGSVVRKGEVLAKRTIPLKHLRKIFETADEMGMAVIYSVDGMEYAYRQTPFILSQQESHNRYFLQPDFTEETWENLELEKVIVMAAVRDGSIHAIEELCKELPSSIEYIPYGNKAIDIQSAEATKENGVRELARLMNLSMDEILFVGDDLNDVSMIKAAGIGVAVGNAQPAAKEAADYVTKEKCYLGVMEAVDKFTGADAWRAAMDNSLRRQSYNLPIVLKEQFENLMNQVRKLLEDGSFEQIDRLILTGCGDSYAAGLALRYPLEELTDLPVELVNAMDLSRYYEKKRMTDKTLVIVVSISGNGFRIKEITEKANACGAMTLAVTKNKDSDIGNRAKRVLRLPLTPFEGGPGNRTYFSSLLALLLFGIAMGEARGVHDEAKSRFYYEEIKKQGELLAEFLPTWEEPLFQLAKDWKEMTGFDFVGSGMEYGSAWFGHAKILEITGAFAMQINSEEWFHMNNFVKVIDQCGTIFLASVNAPGYERTKEAVRYSVRLGRPTLVITDGTEEDLGVKVPCIRVPSADFMPAMALTQYVPVCILAGYMGAMLGEKNCRGCLGPWSFAAGGAFIKEKKEL